MGVPSFSQPVVRRKLRRGDHFERLGRGEAMHGRGIAIGVEHEVVEVFLQDHGIEIGQAIDGGHGGDDLLQLARADVGFELNGVRKVSGIGDAIDLAIEFRALICSRTGSRMSLRKSSTSIFSINCLGRSM